MPIAIDASRILVKTRAGLPTASLALGAAAQRFTATTLFHSIGQGLGIVAPSTWYSLTPATPFDGRNPWDLCHALLQSGLGVAGAAPEFAEPDFQQQWITGRDAEKTLALASGCTAPDPQDARFPRESDPWWYQDPAHGQFAEALAQIGTPSLADAVRIAHLDTGYDPAHATLPARLEKALQRNFVDAGRPNDASDDTEGPLNNLGHGTGTLSILAGKALPGALATGAAPLAKVVPIRVANRVVLFFNSAIAQALDYVHGLCSNDATRVDVVTMSMGGLASEAWADAVNALYEAGVFVVTAAGNNFGNLPTRNIVFPARFARVVAACGVMADNQAYADLPLSEMAGNYGPPSKMDTAIAGYTPNVPWAKLGCADIIDLDGAGTSAATPQVAAAAAIWIQHNKEALAFYPQRWMRVEAARRALFQRANLIDAMHLGRGELRARDALGEAAADSASLKMEPPDSASFPILRTLTGLGVTGAPTAQQRMLELEALQLSQAAGFEEILADPAVEPTSLSVADRLRVVDALASHPLASESLRAALHDLTRRDGRSVAPPVRISDAVMALHLEHATRPPIPQPGRRRLRVYAYDPSLGTHIETLGINEAVLDVAWEQDLRPGPIGEYLEVVDVDPASQCCYAPVDLNDPRLLAQNGLAPAESNPQFHQQMAYAVAMRTIEHFERALGRVALWSPRRITTDNRNSRDEFVRRLRIYPHALRAANAFYSPDRKALLFGYFNAAQADMGDELPGGLIFGTLSHDIVAHETTHALLDGLHRRFREPTNADVLAFHEAFADLVALFQHFTMPEALREALRQQMARTRGDLGQPSLLAELARQFGQASGLHGALRNAVGKAPSRDDYQRDDEPHARGAVLVAAVYDAFVQIYRSRTADLVRLATGGSGVLPPGELPLDLVDRLAREASKVAGQVLNICIRALDYCPPVDITFGEYLRALITSDRDVVPDDKRTYRVAFVSAFRDRGIYPPDVTTLSIGSLAWEPPPLPLKNIGNVLRKMSLDWDLTSRREQAYADSRKNATILHGWLMDQQEVPKDQIEALGLSRTPGSKTIDGVAGELRGIEIHSVRPARRVGPDGNILSDLIVEITQTFRPEGGGRFRGGCTLLVDLRRNEVRYFIRKKVDNSDRLKKQLEFAAATGSALRATYFTDPDRGLEPFALLHRGY